MRRHELDPFSLVFGLLFVFLALFFLIGDNTASDLAWPWTLVVPLLGLGLLAVLLGLRRLAFDRVPSGPAPSREPAAGAEGFARLEEPTTEADELVPSQEPTVGANEPTPSNEPPAADEPSSS